MKILMRIVDGECILGSNDVWDFCSELANKQKIHEDDEAGREKIQEEVDGKLEHWVIESDTIYVEFDLDKKTARVLTAEEVNK